MHVLIHKEPGMQVICPIDMVFLHTFMVCHTHKTHHQTHTYVSFPLNNNFLALHLLFLSYQEREPSIHSSTLKTCVIVPFSLAKAIIANKYLARAIAFITNVFPNETACNTNACKKTLDVLLGLLITNFFEILVSIAQANAKLPRYPRA